MNPPQLEQLGDAGRRCQHSAEFVCITRIDATLQQLRIGHHLGGPETQMGLDGVAHELDCLVWLGADHEEEVARLLGKVTEPAVAGDYWSHGKSVALVRGWVVHGPPLWCL